MLKKIVNTLFSVLRKLIQSLKRFPESLLLITIAAFLLIDSNHQGLISELMKDDFPKLPMIFAMGFVLFLCYRMLNELGSLKYMVMKTVVWITFVVYLVIIYFFLLSELNTVSIISYMAIIFAFIMAFLFVPYLKRKNGFEMYIIKVFIGFLVTYLYAGVLYIGIVAMVFTVDQLFTVQIENRVYLDIWIIAAGIFAPAYFLGGIPEHGEELEEGNYSKVLKILFLYIVMPIISIYTLILYVYFAKVLLTQVWPKGMVSNLVLWYSFITSAVIFLIKPLINNNLWAKKFSRFMPIIIIPLLFMCFWAMGIRINSYGITENRYYVLVGAFWVLFTMVYWIIKKDTKNVVLPISLAIVAILTIVGPQSAFSISFNSQSTRLERLLEKNNMLKDGKFVKAGADISSIDKSEISSILRYIDNNHGLDKLAYVSEDLTLSNVRETLGFELDYGKSYSKYYNYESANIGAIDITGYRYYAEIRSYNPNNNKLNIGDMSLVYENLSGNVKISKQDKIIYEKSINDFVESLPNEGEKNFNMDTDKMTFVDRQGDIEVKYIFRSLAAESDAYGQLKLNHADFSIFIK